MVLGMGNQKETGFAKSRSEPALHGYYNRYLGTRCYGY